MNVQHRQRKILVQLITYIVITAFFCQNIAWAQGGVYRNLSPRTVFENFDKYFKVKGIDLPFHIKSEIFLGFEAVTNRIFPLYPGREEKFFQGDRLFSEIIRRFSYTNPDLKEYINFKKASIQIRSENGNKFFSIDIDIAPPGKESIQKTVIFYDPCRPPLEYLESLCSTWTKDDEDYAGERGFWVAERGTGQMGALGMVKGIDKGEALKKARDNAKKCSAVLDVEGFLGRDSQRRDLIRLKEEFYRFNILQPGMSFKYSTNFGALTIREGNTIWVDELLRDVLVKDDPPEGAAVLFCALLRHQSRRSVSRKSLEEEFTETVFAVMGEVEVFMEADKMETENVKEWLKDVYMKSYGLTEDEVVMDSIFNYIDSFVWFFTTTDFYRVFLSPPDKDYRFSPLIKRIYKDFEDVSLNHRTLKSEVMKRIFSEKLRLCLQDMDNYQRFIRSLNQLLKFAFDFSRDSEDMVMSGLFRFKNWFLKFGLGLCKDEQEKDIVRKLSRFSSDLEDTLVQRGSLYLDTRRGIKELMAFADDLISSEEIDKESMLEELEYIFKNRHFIPSGKNFFGKILPERMERLHLAYPAMEEKVRRFNERMSQAGYDLVVKLNWDHHGTYFDLDSEIEKGRIHRDYPHIVYDAPSHTDDADIMPKMDIGMIRIDEGNWITYVRRDGLAGAVKREAVKGPATVSFCFDRFSSITYGLAKDDKRLQKISMLIKDIFNELIMQGTDIKMLSLSISPGYMWPDHAEFILDCILRESERYVELRSESNALTDEITRLAQEQDVPVFVLDDVQMLTAVRLPASGFMLIPDGAKFIDDHTENRICMGDIQITTHILAAAFGVGLLSEEMLSEPFRKMGFVLLELFRNAIVHGNKGEYEKPFIIKWERQDDKVVFEVYDTGKEVIDYARETPREGIPGRLRHIAGHGQGRHIISMAGCRQEAVFDPEGNRIGNKVIYEVPIMKEDRGTGGDSSPSAQNDGLGQDDRIFAEEHVELVERIFRYLSSPLTHKHYIEVYPYSTIEEIDESGSLRVKEMLALLIHCLSAEVVEETFDGDRLYFLEMIYEFLNNINDEQWESLKVHFLSNLENTDIDILHLFFREDHVLLFMRIFYVLILPPKELSKDDVSNYMKGIWVDYKQDVAGDEDWTDRFDLEEKLRSLDSSKSIEDCEEEREHTGFIETLREMQTKEILRLLSTFTSFEDITSWMIPTILDMIEETEGFKAQVISALKENPNLNDVVLFRLLKEGILGGSEYDKLSNYIKERSSTPPNGTLKNMGRRTVRDEENLRMAKGMEEEWELAADRVSVETRTIKKENITAKFIVDDKNLPEGLFGYHFYDKSGNLVIVTETRFKNEASYHEFREAFWIGYLTPEGGEVTKEIRHHAHILASAKQALAFSKKGELTPYHQSQVDGMTVGQLQFLIDEYESGERERYHHKIISKHRIALEKDFDRGILKRIIDYEDLLINKVKELYDKRVKNLEYTFSEKMTDRIKLLGGNIKNLKDTPPFEPYQRVTLKIPFAYEEHPMLRLTGEICYDIKLLMNDEMVEIFKHHNIQTVIIDGDCEVGLFHVIAHLGGLRDEGIVLGENEGFMSKGKAYCIRSGDELRVTKKPDVKPTRLWKVEFKTGELSSLERSIAKSLNRVKGCLRKGDLSGAKQALEEARKKMKGRLVRRDIKQLYADLVAELKLSFRKKKGEDVCSMESMELSEWHPNKAEHMVLGNRELTPEEISRAIHELEPQIQNMGNGEEITLIINGKEIKHIVIEHEGKKFLADKQLVTETRFSHERFLAQLSKAMAEDRKLYGTDWSKLPEFLIFTCLQKSKHLFEDCRRNHFIGINPALFEIEDQAAKEVMLAVGLVHEFRHEAGIEGEHPEWDAELTVRLLKSRKIKVYRFIDLIGMFLDIGEEYLQVTVTKGPKKRRYTVFIPFLGLFLLDQILKLTGYIYGLTGDSSVGLRDPAFWENLPNLFGAVYWIPTLNPLEFPLIESILKIIKEQTPYTIMLFPLVFMLDRLYSFYSRTKHILFGSSYIRNTILCGLIVFLSGILSNFTDMVIHGGFIDYMGIRWPDGSAIKTALADMFLALRMPWSDGNGIVNLADIFEALGTFIITGGILLWFFNMLVKLIDHIWPVWTKRFTDSAWIYTASGKEPASWNRRKLEEKAHGYLERAGRQNRIKRVWGHGSKGRQPTDDIPGIIDFISSCAEEAGLPEEGISIGLVEPEEDDEELMGFSHLREPGESSYMALTAVGGRYGESPYTIYLRSDDVFIYRELGEEGKEAFIAKLRHEYSDAQRKLNGEDQIHQSEGREVLDLINKQEENVLRIKRLLQNRLIDYVLHIGDYFDDYQFIQDFISCEGLTYKDEIFRKYGKMPGWITIRIADKYIYRELGIRSRELIKGAFLGDKRFHELVRSNIVTANNGPLFEKAAVKNLYLLLRAVEVLSKDTDFMKELHQTVVDSIMEGPVEGTWKKLLTVPEQTEEESLNEFDPHEEREGGLTPFLMWLGRKTRLLPFLKPLFPRRFNRYFEPFFGSGAVFFHCQFQGSVINDRCQQLMNIYTALRDEPEEVIKYLEEYLQRYFFTESGESTTMEEKMVYYYCVRALPWRKGSRKPVMWDELHDRYFDLPQTSAHQAARMIFLNRACKIGMWRFNSYGDFSVPFGNRETLGITRTPLEISSDSKKYLCQREMFLAISRTLQDMPLYSMDYEEVLKHAKAGDFIYLDPPYHTEEGYPGFTRYSKGEFKELQQWKLARVFHILHKRGCYVMLSNYSTEFIRRLYAGFDIETVRVRSKMAAMRGGKTVVKEVIIRNFVNEEKKAKVEEIDLRLAMLELISYVDGDEFILTPEFVNFGPTAHSPPTDEEIRDILLSVIKKESQSLFPRIAAHRMPDGRIRFTMTEECYFWGKTTPNVGYTELLTDPRKHTPHNFCYMARAVLYPDKIKSPHEITSASFINSDYSTTKNETGVLIEVPEQDVIYASSRNIYSIHKPKTIEYYRNLAERDGLLSPHELMEETERGGIGWNELIVVSENIKYLGVFIEVPRPAGPDEPETRKRQYEEWIGYAIDNNLPIVILESRFDLSEEVTEDFYRLIRHLVAKNLADKELDLCDVLLPIKTSSQEIEQRYADFKNSMITLKRITEDGYNEQAVKMEAEASTYNPRYAQTLVLYTETLLDNCGVIDLEEALKIKAMVENNILRRVVLYAEDRTSISILENLLVDIVPTLEIKIVTKRELDEQSYCTGTEANELEDLLRFLRDEGIYLRNTLGVIKGATAEEPGIKEISEIWGIPIVIFEETEGKAIYSFAQAVRMAIEARKSKSGWFIVLPPIKIIMEDIQKEWDGYKNSLQLLRSA